MPADSAAHGLVRVLGARAAAALREWAAAQSHTVRLASPEWTAQGYTGAVLAAINVSTPGEPDIKVIVKVCPPSPYVREPTAHQQAKAKSSGDFYSTHLVDQPYGAHPVVSGELLMFQEIAGATLDGVPLSKVPDEDLARSCEVVVHSILTEWQLSAISTVEITVADYLMGELRGALGRGGSINAMAGQMRLLQPDTTWIFDASRDGRSLPNPLLMVSDPALGARIRFDAVYGPAHGDLHLENVLIPNEYGRLQPEKFRLVDLSTFEPAAPVTRDPVTLMLSVIASGVSQLRAEEQEALLDFVLEPWTPTPQRLSVLTASTLETIYRTGNEAIKLMRLGDWRSQYLLSVQATALLFTSFDNVGEAGRWWFLRLAAHAGAAFLRRHNAYHPGTAVRLRRPVEWPHKALESINPPSVEQARKSRSHKRPPMLRANERTALVTLLSELPQPLLASAFHDMADAPGAGQPDWTDVAAVVRVLQDIRYPSAITPPLFAYVDRLAHAAGGAMGLELHRWLTATARRQQLGDEALRLLCSESYGRAESSLDLRAPHGIGRVDSEISDLITNEVVYPDQLVLPGGTMIPDTALLLGAHGVTHTPPRPVIIGSLPARNPDFTGREQLLRELADKLGESSSPQEVSAVAVIPQALHGLGGVGKTQLAIEFVYRNLEHYELVWWISAEDPALIRASLVELAKRLELPQGQDVKQTISLVMDALSTTGYRWLLVYDNVDLQEHLHGLVPPAHGSVIITSRNNAAWGNKNAIEVDVFERAESIELLRRHGQSISSDDADRLAQKLGDLPLALEQAAIWHVTTGMPISEYLELFDQNVQDLMTEGRPHTYQGTVYGILKVAIDRLRSETSAAAELLELFAYLGAEPISVDLLRRGRGAGLSQDLGAALHRPIQLNRIIRELRRYGLARVDRQGQLIQVHRLVQRVLREDLKTERRAQSKENVQQLLASANPGYPDEPRTWPVHAEIGPHIRAAELIYAADENARAVVLDQIRYLYKIGDYEGSKALGETAYTEWSGALSQSGQDQELALIAGRHLANALRPLGETERARELNSTAFERLRSSPEFGEDHEHTLYTSNGLGVDLRLKGDLAAALDVEEANVQRHLRVLGPDEEQTWRAQNNLAVSLRHLGDYRRAADIDQHVVERWRQRFGDDDPRTLFSISNLARDLYGLGRYRAALELQRNALPSYRDQLGERHGDVLIAARTMTITLRKCGYHADARDNGRNNYHDHNAKFGPNHEHTLSAMVSYANALLCCQEFTAAGGLLEKAVNTYREVFGPLHPFTLAAMVNQAIALRSTRDRRRAATVDEHAYASLTDVLGADHPYTLSAANGQANSLALAGDVTRAKQLSTDVFRRARQVHGEDHPETLAYAVNAAFDLQSATDQTAGRELMEQSLARMRHVLGPDHPDTLDAARGERAECDIESPPT